MTGRCIHVISHALLVLPNEKRRGLVLLMFRTVRSTNLTSPHTAVVVKQDDASCASSSILFRHKMWTSSVKSRGRTKREKKRFSRSSGPVEVKWSLHRAAPASSSWFLTHQNACMWSELAVNHVKLRFLEQSNSNRAAKVLMMLSLLMELVCDTAFGNG